MSPANTQSIMRAAFTLRRLTYRSSYSYIVILSSLFLFFIIVTFLGKLLHVVCCRAQSQIRAVLCFLTQVIAHCITLAGV